MERDGASRRVRIGCRDITAGAIASSAVSGGKESGGEGGSGRSLRATEKPDGTKSFPETNGQFLLTVFASTLLESPLA
ncbi:hypothetical protein BHE74_00034700 [Ensete ventricosum]|nr:hypothetical protein BHE74_00034700 [Ensete ventricosum]